MVEVVVILVEEADLAPSGLLERTEADLDLAPAVAVVAVVEAAVFPSLPAMRWSTSW